MGFDPGPQVALPVDSADGTPDNAPLTFSFETEVWDGVSSPGYYAFPGVVEVFGGDILAVTYVGDQHVSRDGKLVAKKSSDGGATWGTEFTVLDNANDLRDPEVARLADDTIICSFFEWISSGDNEEPYTIRSADGGDTWDTPVHVSHPFTDYAACSAKVIEDSTGDLLLPLYGKDTGDTFQTSTASRSTDGGDTWAHLAVIADGEADGRQYAEPNITRDPTSGRIYAMLRSDTGTNDLWLCHSDDDGATWSSPAVQFLGSGRPSLFWTAGDLLVCCYRNSPPKWRSSANGGTTWSGEETVNTAFLSMYASWCDRSNGNIGLLWSVEKSSTRCDVNYQEFTT